VIARGTFLSGVASATVATGGLDVWDGSGPQIRVLVAADAGGEVPHVFADGTFVFAGRRWRGAPSTVGTPDGRMALVTTIGVDGYLQGVVPLEAPPSWPAGALAAQAIVARTFALARRTLSRPYDVRADDGDQRWGGVDAETPSTTAAVARTRGQTLAYGGAQAAVFYSSCCGGHTADIASAWGGTPLPYLRGVEDPHCVPAPDYRWQREVPLSRVIAAFGSRTGARITGASLAGIDDTGRPREVVLTGTGTAVVPVADFRRALGYDAIRSPWLSGLRIEGAGDAGRLVVDGCGRGHGVGLCQWGARFFAAAGASANDILAFYFPGTSVVGG
jgi:stage II sporulation protein D